MEFMMRKHPDFRLSQETLNAAFRYAHSVEMMQCLLSWRHPDAFVDTSLVMATLRNPKCTTEFLLFLCEQLSPEVILNKVLPWVKSMHGHRLPLIELALTRKSFGTTLSDRDVTHICAEDGAVDFIQLLVNKNMAIPITEGVMFAAAMNSTEAPMLIKLLAQIHGQPLPVTELVFHGATFNSSSCLEVLKTLVKVSPGNAIPDRVFWEAGCNPASMSWLLDQRSSDLPLEDMIEVIADTPETMIPTLQILLDRKLVYPDDWLVERLAGSLQALEFLQAWDPKFPVTETALLQAADEDDAMNFILNTHHEALPITERVMRKVVVRRKPLALLERLCRRCESTAITKNAIMAALSSCHLDNVDLLLKQRPDIEFSDLWDELWRSSDQTARGRFRNSLRLGKLDNPDSTSGLLQTYPDFVKEDYELDDFVKQLMYFPVNSLSTEESGAVILERCPYQTCKKYMEFSRLSVTDKLIDAATRNRTSTNELVVLLLTKGAQVAALEASEFYLIDD
ncbi:unnamed protein product [Penicillium salamii]|nr:unnamed protein product [Penicillium salamii]